MINAHGETKEEECVRIKLKPVLSLVLNRLDTADKSTTTLNERHCHMNPEFTSYISANKAAQ